MNSRRGFISMPPVNLGLHFDGIGALPRLKLRPQVARKMLLEANRWTGKEALEDGIVDVVAEPEEMLNVALEMGAKWAPKAKMGYVHSLNFDFIRRIYVDGHVLIAVNIGYMPCSVRSFGETRSRNFRGLVMFMVV